MLLKRNLKQPHSFSSTQNVLSVGASPQEVLQAQREAATQAAQHAAERAEILHNVAMHQAEQQAQGFVEDAMSNLDLLRAQVAEATHVVISFKPLKLTSRFVKRNLPEFKLSLHEVQFQLNQQKILCQVKEREIQRLRSAALSAMNASQAVSQAAAASSATLNYPNQQFSSPAPTESLPA